MKYLILILALSLSSIVWSQSSMRRCTLLPVTDSVGGAIGFKVFEEVEAGLRKSTWCTYISNSSMMGVFTRYKDNLPKFLKEPEVVKTVADKLKVGSILRVNIISELKGIELQLDVVGENGVDLYFSEKMVLESDDIEVISQSIKNWLDVYSKQIPYDGKVTGILGEQITFDVGKGYPIKVGQEFTIKRLSGTKKHPLLKKIIDFDSEVLAQGEIFSISDNQALGMVKVYKHDKKLLVGDWLKLEALKSDSSYMRDALDKPENPKPGTLGLLSLYLFGSQSSTSTTTTTDSQRMSGNMFGFDVRGELWLTRNYFGAVELMSAIGTQKKSSGTPDKSSVNVNNNTFKLTGGYKYLPIGFFYGPQIDIYTGYANHTFDVDFSAVDGFGKSQISGLVLGSNINLPISRDYRFFANVEVIPFPTFKDSDSLYGSAKSVSSMEFEVGGKYQYLTNITLDASLEVQSHKAKFKGDIKEVSYKDTFLKLGATFNF